MHANAAKTRGAKGSKLDKRPEARRSNRLKDQVYRAMYLVEAERPGAGLKLAMALLHAWVEADVPSPDPDFAAWLRGVRTVSLRLLASSRERENARATDCPGSRQPGRT